MTRACSNSNAFFVFCFAFLQLGSQLGRGYFTEFFEACIKQPGVPAAPDVVMLTQFSASELDAAGYELDILAMTSVHHKNVCACFAANTMSHPYMMISEYLHQVRLGHCWWQQGEGSESFCSGNLPEQR